jgi:formylglycine-generating enzyme required for sulfatase activity
MRKRNLLLLLVGLAVTIAAIVFFIKPSNRNKPEKIVSSRKPECVRGKCPGGMCYVPAGEFIMGCYKDNECSGDEKPSKRVYLDAFCIDRTEVTQGVYVKAMGKNPSGFKKCSAECPVESVRWDEAAVYCGKAGKRLPTEAEWEKAARGTDGRKYPWGDRWSGKKANFCDSGCGYEWADKNEDDGFKETSPAGSFPAGASPYGLLDMGGNVWEWTRDCYDADWYAKMPVHNPVNVSSGCGYRVLRGGSWYYMKLGVRAADRIWVDRIYKDSSTGFRCASSAE